jgi:hypothetical protein
MLERAATIDIATCPAFLLQSKNYSPRAGSSPQSQISKLHIPNAEILDASNQYLCGREGVAFEGVF